MIMYLLGGKHNHDSPLMLKMGCTIMIMHLLGGKHNHDSPLCFKFSGVLDCHFFSLVLKPFPILS
jgi:hypothetical protein